MPSYCFAILLLGGVLLLVVIYCLLAMAQRADAHLEQLGLGEAGGQSADRPTGMAASLGEGPEDRWVSPMSL